MGTTTVTFFIFLLSGGVLWMSTIFVTKNLFHGSIESQQKSWKVWREIWAWPSFILVAIGLWGLVFSM